MEPQIGTNLPGRAIDIVHAAAQQAGLTLDSFHLALYGRAPALTGYLDRDGDRSQQAAATIFARLGVTETTLDPRSEHNHSAVEAYVPAAGVTLTIIIDSVQQQAQPADAEALVAQVDAARAAADEQDASGGEQC